MDEKSYESNDDKRYEQWLQDPEQMKKQTNKGEEDARLAIELRKKFRSDQEKPIKQETKHIGNDLPKEDELADDVLGQAEKIVYEKQRNEQNKKVLDIRHMADQGSIGNEKKFDTMKDIGEFEKEQINNN